MNLNPISNVAQHSQVVITNEKVCSDKLVNFEDSTFSPTEKKLMELKCWIGTRKDNCLVRMFYSLKLFGRHFFRYLAANSSRSS